ncbi:response regulator transcription factor [Microbacterium sp. X-17]|uniref:response regulator transcription factor n=1 Tax=Microbacterium sp. X-17 TaxID=3144404 RepID=UPI0031F5CE6F
MILLTSTSDESRYLPSGSVHRIVAMSSIRVLVADDEKLIRAALRVFVSSAEDIELVGEAVDGADAVAKSRRSVPDVVLMDLQMPVMDGIEATAAIATELPDVRVLVLTSLASDRRIVEALRAGASGYLLKDTSPEDVIAAIHAAHRGDTILSPRLARALVSAVQDSDDRSRSAPSSGDLTEREMSIVRLLATGRANAEIASTLHLAETTVKANLSRIMRKWALRDRVQVLIHAVRLGLVQL